jgi:4-amino-4-deoxy-L-arabinose transferase-like glycosyltransferase
MIRGAPYLFALAAAALRVALALRDLDVIDRLFVPDDTYYTLAVARSLARGLGPSVDGEHLTSGFQPLLAFLLAPVFAITSDDGVPLRAALVLLALVDAANVLLLAALARRLRGERAALWAAALWALSPVAVANAMGGLETSLAVACVLALAILSCRSLEQPSNARFALAGGAAGLSLLARVDTVFLVAMLGAYGLWRGPRRGALIGIAAAAAVVAPWWIYMLVRFSTVVPESGAAVVEQVRWHQTLYLTAGEQMAWALGSVLVAPAADGAPIRAFFYEHPAAAGPLLALFCIGAGLLAAKLVRDAKSPPIGLLFANALVILAFYTFAVPALWFFRRYLAPVHAATALLAAAGLALLLERAQPRVARVAAAAAVLALASSAMVSTGYLLANPRSTPDLGLHGAKGYREVARDVFALVPPGAVLAAFQSGALAYHAPPGVRVVNMDGVVDGEAARAFRDRKLAAFARGRGVTHFADWPFNVQAFVAHAGEPRFRLRPLGAARAQGSDRMTVFAVEWD